MKKVFAILVLGTVLTACNNGGEESKTAETDSPLTESPLMDAVNTADSAGKVIEAGLDTAVKVIESGKEMIKP